MAAPIILPNRLKRFQDTLVGTGQTINALGQQARANRLQDASEERASTLFGLQKEQSELGLQGLQRQEGQQQELLGLRSQLQSVSQGMGDDPAAQAIKDQILAKIRGIETGNTTTASQVAQGRERQDLETRGLRAQTGMSEFSLGRAPTLAGQQDQMFGANLDQTRAGTQNTLSEMRLRDRTGSLTPGEVGANTSVIQPVTPGQEALDKAYAKDLIPFMTGGFADAQKNLKQLQQAQQAIASGKKAISGPMIGLLPDEMKRFTNPEAIDVREAVEEIVQRNLRVVLGAQFTEKEGDRLIARAFNPSLSEERNAVRLDRLAKSMESALNAKKEAADYFQTHGTLRGFDLSKLVTDQSQLLVDDEPARSGTKIGRFEVVGAE